MMKRGLVAFVLLLIFLLSFYVRIIGFRFPYLRNIDSYVFYRYMDYVIEYGKLPDVDPLMLAPTGNPINPHGFLYVYIGAYAYKLFSLVHQMSLWRFLVYFPPLLASLMVFPAYYIGKRLYDTNAGLIAAFLVVFAPTIMSRTLGGDPDSDSIVMLMSLLTFASFVFSSTSKKLWPSAVTGLVYYIFSETWSGNWYMFWVMVGYSIAKSAYNYFMKHDWKKPLIKMAIIFAVFGLMNVVVYGAKGLEYTTMPVRAFFQTAGIFGSGGLKSEEGRQFPNVYVSVAEMQSSNLATVMANAGGNLFIPALAGLAYLVYSFLKRKKHFDILVMLGIWFVGFFYASLVAIRFTIFLVLPVIFLSSIALSKTWRILQGEKLEE